MSSFQRRDPEQILSGPGLIRTPRRRTAERQGSPALGTPSASPHSSPDQARVFKVTLLRSTGFVATHSAYVSPRSKECYSNNVINITAEVGAKLVPRVKSALLEGFGVKGIGVKRALLVQGLGFRCQKSPTGVGFRV